MNSDYLISLGIGKNQKNFLKIAHKIGYKNIICIDNKKLNLRSRFCKQIFKGSIYNFNFIKKIIPKIKKINSNFKVIFRSSGPSIISLYILEKYLNCIRVDKDLAYSVYSKSYFSNFLKKKKIPFIKVILKKKFNYKNLDNKMWVMKPDAPIVGKKNVYFTNKKDLKKKYFNLCKKESHNNKVLFSEFINGHDLTIFFIISNKSNFKKITIINEWVGLKNNKFYGIGISNPAANLQKKIQNEIIKLSKKIMHNFINFKGVASISFRVNTSKKLIVPYEINIGLSGDGFADKIYPNSIKGPSLYNLEIDTLLNRKIKKFKFENKTFCGLYFGKMILTENTFLDKIKAL
jgi:hypothetical protein